MGSIEWTPGNNPNNFKQHYDHGESLQLHKIRRINVMVVAQASPLVSTIKHVYSIGYMYTSVS
jgi:hypothetical protein